MRMELIQPFIDAADSVFSEILAGADQNWRSLHG